MKLTSGVGLIKKSFNIFFEKNNFTFLIKVYFFSFLLNLLSYFFEMNKGNSMVQNFLGNPLSIVATFSFLFASIWARIAEFVAVRKVAKSEKFEVKKTFIEALKLWPKFFGADILVILIIFLGVIALVVPGLIFAVWFGFTLFVVASEKTTFFGAFKKSKALVKGKFWKVVGRIIVLLLLFVLPVVVLSLFIPWGLGPTIFTIFGGLFLLPSYLLYLELAKG